MASSAKLSPQVIDQNFPLFLDVVRFISGNKYLPEIADSKKKLKLNYKIIFLTIRNKKKRMQLHLKQEIQLINID